MQRKKAQGGVEFIFAVGIVLLIFLALLFISIDKRNEVKDAEDFIDKRNECIKVANSISTVFNYGGSEVHLSTKYLIGLPYGGAVEVSGIKNKSIAQKFIPFRNVTCTYVPKKSPYIVPEYLTGDFIIKNVGGEVVIEKL